MEYLNKNRKQIAIAMTVIGLVLILLGIYFINNNKKDNSDKNKNVEESDNTKTPDQEKVDDKDDEKDKDSEEIKKLYEIAKMDAKMESLTQSTSLTEGLVKYIYSKKETKIKELDRNVFFLFRLIRFIQNERYNFEYIEYEKDDPYTIHIEIKKSELKKVLYTLFGDEYTIDDFELYRKRIVNTLQSYDKEKDTYTLIKDGIFVDLATIETKLIKVEKDENYIYLYEKVGVTTTSKTKYFSNILDLKMNYNKEKEFLENNKDKAKDLNGKSIWEYEDDLPTFRYVLKKDKNGEYHLDSMGYVEIK